MIQTKVLSVMFIKALNVFYPKAVSPLLETGELGSRDCQ